MWEDIPETSGNYKLNSQNPNPQVTHAQLRDPAAVRKYLKVRERKVNGGIGGKGAMQRWGCEMCLGAGRRRTGQRRGPGDMGWSAAGSWVGRGADRGSPVRVEDKAQVRSEEC